MSVFLLSVLLLIIRTFASSLHYSLNALLIRWLGLKVHFIFFFSLVSILSALFMVTRGTDQIVKQTVRASNSNQTMEILQYKEKEYFGIIVAPANVGHDLLTTVRRQRGFSCKAGDCDAGLPPSLDGPTVNIRSTPLR